MSNSCYTNQIILDLTYATDLSGFVSSSWEWIIYQIIWPCVIVFGICTNVSFIWTVIKTPSLHTTTYRYLINLAFSDLLFLVTYYIPRIVYYQESLLKRRTPIILNTITYLFWSSSCGTVTLVSLERFLAICYPIKHRLVKGTRRTNRLICSVWCVPLCLTVPLFFVSKTSSLCIVWPDDSAYADYPNQYTTYSEINGWTSIFLHSINFVTFLFLMIFNNVLYIKIYLVLKRRNINDLGLNSSPQHRQVAKMLIVNGIFFFLCVSLQIFVNTVILIYGYFLNDNGNPLLFFICELLGDVGLGLNACMNPVLYLITNKRYRHAFVTVFTWSKYYSQNKTEVNAIEMPNINQI